MSNNPEITRLPLAVDELQKRVTELEAALREQEKIVADYRQNEDTYRSLFKNMLNGLVHCRMVFKNGQPDDFIFLTVNEVFESLTGLKDVIGKKVTELFPTIRETDPKIFEVLGLVSLSGQPERFEIFLEAAKEWLSVSVYSPKEEHFVAVFDVITKRKKTEQALRDSLDHASRLSNLLELSSQPFAQGFPDGSFGLLNQAFLDLTGYTREELANITWKELTPPEWFPLEEENLEKLQSTGEAVRYQKEYIRKDGSRVPVELFVHLIREKDGKPKYYYGFITDITERKRAQKSLQVAYTKYKMLFQSFPLGITIADDSGQILESNRMAEKILGLPSEAHKQRHIDSKEWQVVRPDGSPMPYEEYASVRALKEGRLIENVEMGIAKSSGGITWLSVAATPIPLDEGGVIVTYLDITERKRMQDELRWSEERLHLALHAANAGTWEWDLRTNESSWSEELWELYRMRPHSAAPSFDVWLETVHPDDRAKAEESLKEAVRRGTKLNVEWRVNDPVGKDRWLMLRGRPAYDIAGRMGRFIGISIDITDRKKAELALKESEQKFKIVADHTYDFEYWFDPNGNYIYASPSCERIYGYSSSEFISDPSLQRQVVHPEDLARFDEHLLAVEAAHTHGEIEFRIVRKDGGIRWIEHACQAVFDEQGHYLGVRGSNRDVTERKQAEAALRESDQRLRLALTASHAGAWELNLITGEHTWSEELWKVFGFEPGSLTPSFDAWLQTIHPDQREDAKRHVEETMRIGGGTGFTYEWQMPTGETGQEHWLMTRCTPLQNDDGKPTRLIGIVIDITERKKAEEKLRKSEAQFRSLINGSPYAVFVQTNHVISYANIAMCRLFGVSSQEDLLGKPIIDRVHPEFRDRVKERIRRLNEEKQPVDVMEQIMVRMDGTSVPVEASAVPTVYEGKNGALVFLRDITERKRAEEALQESEKKLQLFIDHAPVALAMFDRNMHYLAASIRWIADYNLINREIIGKSHYEVFPNLLERWKEAHQRGLSGETVKSDEDRFEQQDGSVLWNRWEVRPWHTASGEVGGIVIFSEDITERKTAETEKRNLQQQLAEAQKMESVGRLAGGVAHEFNNMLNVIIGYAELSLYKADRSIPLYDNLLEILKAANRSAEIARKLLAFARKQIFLPKVIDLNETVESMIGALGKLASDNIRLVWLPARKLYPVKIAPVQIDQILTNLCLNARDAISGMGNITIRTANETLDESYCAGRSGFFPGDFAVLSVSDNGCGMDKETLENVFEPFFTTKEVGKGTGLGLSMVYGIVRQNNGLITVDSEPGKGTTMKIYLPRNESQVSETKAESANDIPVGHGETILLVDDEHQVLMTNKLILEKLGYTVLATETPEEAVRLAEEHAGEIHLLITDVVMPKMNGHDLAIHLHGLYPDMQILYVSGYSANVITEQGMLEKFDNFLQKPFTMKNLAKKIREVMDKK